MTDLETEYEHYKEKTEFELIELREKLAEYENDKDSVDELRNQLLAQKFQVQQGEETNKKLVESHKQELEKLQRDLAQAQG